MTPDPESHGAMMNCHVVVRVKAHAFSDRLTRDVALKGDINMLWNVLRTNVRCTIFIWISFSLAGGLTRTCVCLSMSSEAETKSQEMKCI